MNVSALLSVFARITAVVTAALLLAVYYTNLPLWSDLYFGTTNTPLFYLALMCIASVSGIANMRSVREYLITDYAKWCLAVLVVSALNVIRLHLMEFPQDDVYGALDNLQYFLLAPTIGYLVFISPQRVFQPFLKLMAVAVPSLIIADFLWPELLRSGQEAQVESLVTKSRVAGTWFNPNAAGEAVVLILILVRNYFSKISMSLVFTLAGLALIFTGSRSGLTILGILGVFLLFQRRLPIIYLVVPVVITLFFSSMLIFFEDVASVLGREAGIQDSIDRLEFMVGEGGEEDDSSISRGVAAKFAFLESFEKPILGHGIAFVDKVWKVGAHNQLFEWMYLYGFVGVFIWLGLTRFLYKAKPTNRWINPEMFVFFWYSMFTHNIGESNYWFIFFALTVFVTYGSRDKSFSNPSFAGYSSGTSTKRRRSRRRKRKRVTR